MVIDEKTLTMTVLPYMSKEQFNELVEKCDEVPLDKPLLDMTCGEFIQSMEDDFLNEIFKEPYLYDAIGKYKRYKAEMEQIDQYLKLNEFKLSSEEERAQMGINFPSFPERILLTVTEFFHLHSFKEAEKIPFTNYLVVVNSKNADAKFERQYQKIIDQKNKMKRK